MAGGRGETSSDGFFETGSVGAIAVSPSQTDVIYVGMGEGCLRGNLSPGDGVYKSTDGGESWEHLGLADTQHIGRVRIHPENPDIVYVAALGHAFGPSPERGVFRSQDGGKSWEKVLFRSEKAGAIDLSMDPQDSGYALRGALGSATLSLGLSQRRAGFQPLQDHRWW